VFSNLQSNHNANVGLGKLYFDNNTKKIGISEYLKKISREQLKEIL
jgi:hypothetical protein